MPAYYQLLLNIEYIDLEILNRQQKSQASSSSRFFSQNQQAKGLNNPLNANAIQELNTPEIDKKISYEQDNTGTGNIQIDTDEISDIDIKSEYSISPKPESSIHFNQQL